MTIGRALRTYIALYEVSLILVLAFVGLGLLFQDWGEEVFRSTLGLVLVFAGWAWLLLALFLGSTNRNLAVVSTRTLLMTAPGKPPFMMASGPAGDFRKRREVILKRYDQSILAGITGLTVLGLAALVAVNVWLALGALLAEMAVLAYLLVASRAASPL